MKLSSLKIGQCGQVVKVNGEGAVKRRLLDMGITPSVQITVVKKAPLGDPMEISLRGYRLTLRALDADMVAVNEVKG